MSLASSVSNPTSAFFDNNTFDGLIDPPSPSPVNNYDFADRNGNYDEHDDCSHNGICDGRSLAAALIVFFFCAGILLVVTCIKKQQQPMQSPQDETNIADNGTNRNSNSFQAEDANGPAITADVMKRMTSSERKTFVSTFLPAKKFKTPMENDEETSMSSGSDSREHDIELGEVSLRECAVCLESFVDDDDICASNNPDCRHVFHRRCMHSWLLKHEECPICRRPYLDYDPFEEILL